MAEKPPTIKELTTEKLPPSGGAHVATTEDEPVSDAAKRTIAAVLADQIRRARRTAS